MTTKQKEVIGVSIALIVLTGLTLAAAISFTVKAAASNHEEPEPPGVKIETERGFEYPGLEKDTL